jgi:hypothetical protein
MSLLCVICYRRPPKTSLGHCMVIVTDYELIENPQTGLFMFGVQNLSPVLVAVVISK